MKKTKTFGFRRSVTQKKGLRMKNKAVFSVRLDAELYKKLIAVAEAEGRNVNNHMLHLIRTNIAYHERVHGRVDTSKVVLPAEDGES